MPKWRRRKWLRTAIFLADFFYLALAYAWLVSGSPLGAFFCGLLVMVWPFNMVFLEVFLADMEASDTPNPSGGK